MMTRCRENLLLAALLVSVSLPLRAQPTITPCEAAFNPSGIVINGHYPHDAFFSAGSVVKHVSSVQPGDGRCGFGPLLPDIELGFGVTVSSGLALDRSGNLFVAAGRGANTSLLKIAPPYDHPPVIVFDRASNIAGLAVRNHILYAADFGSGTVLRFDLKESSGKMTVLARVPGVFGIFAAGKDDLFVTSNAGGRGANDVRHITPEGIKTVATGLGFPEGISGDDDYLYIASNAVVFRVPREGGVPVPYAAGPIRYSHAMFVFEDAGYVSDSNHPGHVFKFSLSEERMASGLR